MVMLLQDLTALLLELAPALFEVLPPVEIIVVAPCTACAPAPAATVVTGVAPAAAVAPTTAAAGVAAPTATAVAAVAIVTVLLPLVPAPLPLVLFFVVGSAGLAEDTAACPDSGVPACDGCDGGC